MYGHELLATLGNLAPLGNAAAMMRHAERYPITDPKDPASAELMPSGIAAAKEFGKRLNGFDQVRLFHSPVKRCRQTAECIAEGASAKGLGVELCGSVEALGIDYILDLPETGRLSQLHGDRFVRLWFSGKISTAAIRPAVDIAEEKIAFIAGRLGEPSQGGRRLDLHVSHDWNVIILRDHMLGIRYEDTEWLDFLDGIAFSGGSGSLEAVYRNTERRQPLPWNFRT